MSTTTLPAEVVLCWHLPGEGTLQSEFQTVPIACDDGDAYWAGINAWWESCHTIVNVEHDLEVTDAEIAAILACPEKLCAWNYQMHWISTGSGTETLPHTRNGVFVQEGDEWADWSAIGFVKIAPEARIAPLRRVHWRQVESAIDEAVAKPWHLHGPPVPHHHW